MIRQTIRRLATYGAILALLVSALAGCAAPGQSVVKADELHSDKPRLEPLSPQEAAVPEMVPGNSAFAFDLYREVYDGAENLFYSPHSISVALAMTFAGARARTEQQMAEVMHYTLPQTQLHAAFNALDRALASRAEGNGDEAFRLHIANSIWGQQGVAFLDAFLDTLGENYGAGLQTVDFAQSEAARQLINAWVSDETEERIPELLPERAVSAETALVLANAVYFKAAWLHPFAEAATADRPFRLLSNDEVSVPMMSQIAELGYARAPGVQLVELPYAGEDLSMVILLPDEGEFERLAQSLDAQQVAGWLEGLQRQSLALTMPKFTFDAGFELKDALMALGMVDAFGDADFSEMDGTKELFIEQVYHKAFVAVDEAGTEASAATAVVVGRKAAVADQTVTVDRPFVFLIRDIETGAILFLGQVVNPAA
jgi:serpin B